MDLVYVDERRRELILVELKLGTLMRPAMDQISRYLDNAPQSSLLRAYLDRGFKLRGMLATVVKSDFTATRSDVTVRFIDERRAIKVLVGMRGG